MKIKYIFLTLAVLICMTVSVYATEAPLRVGLFYGATALEKVTIASTGGFETDAAEDLGTELVATVSEGNIMLHNLEGDVLIYAGADGREIRAVAREGIFTVEGKGYRGNVIFRPMDGKITVINEIMTDDYLRGVVAGEMPSSWPVEALKAQAVAARCYALNALNKHADFGFDVCATTNCQVYGGTQAETEATNRAVEETAGIVALYNGKVVNTLFSSSNGGYAEASENVWGGSSPYFQTFKDEFEKTDEISGAVWKYEISPQQLKEELAGNGVDIGDILNMEIVKTSRSGRVLEVKITGTTGTKSYIKSYARTFLGLKSQLYTIIPPTGTAVFCLGANGQETISGNYYVLTDEGLDTRKAEEGNPNYVFNGRGYGHGVGMSQWGARYMSEQGLTYEDILKYYFKGIELKSYTEAIL